MRKAAAILLALGCWLAADAAPKQITVSVGPLRSAAATGITFVEKATNADINGTSAVITKPTGTAEGDLMLLFFALDTDSAPTYPSGFVELETSTLGTAGFKAAWKLAGASEGADYTTTFLSTESGVGAIVCYRGVDQTTPVPADGIESGAPGAGVAHTTAALTPAENNCMLVGVIFIDPAASVAFTEVSGFPLRASAVRSASGAMAIADRLQTTATSEGVQITEDQGSTWGEYTLVVAP